MRRVGNNQLSYGLKIYEKKYFTSNPIQQHLLDWKKKEMGNIEMNKILPPTFPTLVLLFSSTSYD